MVAAFAIAGIYANRENLAIRIKSVFVPVPPKAAQSPPPSKRTSTAFVGDAPWALSALPECFTQTSKSTGPLNYVLANLPSGASMLRPGASMDVANCHVAIEGDSVIVSRGSDRMRIPAPARVYEAHGTTALLRGARGGYELRVYRNVAAPLK